jgi:hypothetical protein
MGKLPMENRSTAVKPVRGKVEKIQGRMPIQKSVEKRYCEPMKSAAAYEG